MAEPVSAPVFANVDGTDWPQQVPGWTVQSAPAPAATNPGPGTKVFAHTPEHTDTPASVAGWTVQSVGEYAS